MFSVTKRVEMIKQPRSGYLKTGLFVKEEYSDNIILNKNENIEPQIVGLAVDYLTRLMSGVPVYESFRICMLGAKKLDKYSCSGIREQEKAKLLLESVTGLDDVSIINACGLSRYDVCVRASCKDYKDDTLKPDEYAIENIRNMVNRSLAFFNREGGITETNITFENAYTDIISSGDADYLTSNGLWDMKVSKNDLNAQQTLQLLIYYLMGMKSNPQKFENISRLGFYNPRKNMSYWIDPSFIPQSVVSIVAREVIGY